MSDINLWEVIIAKFDELHTRLDNLDKKQDEMNETLVRNTVSLEVHVKRTDMLEAEIKPMKSFMTVVNAGLKIIGAGAVLVSLVTGIIQIVKILQIS
jgi:hypothetical protein